MTDTDGDGIPDYIDNCVYTPNTDQSDVDEDGIGDVCDTDVEIKKAEVEWDKDKIKVHGKISLPVGKSYFDVTPVSLVNIDVSTLADVVNQNVAFEIKGDEGEKWEYKSDTNDFGIEKFKINWKGAKFDYNQDIKLKSNHIGEDTSTLEIDRKNVTDALSITVENVVIQIDETGVVTVTPDTLTVDVDEDGEIEIDLPFTITPDTIFYITQAGIPDFEVIAGDYYTDGYGRFEIKARFDSAGMNGDIRPATFSLEVTLGELNFPALFEIFEADWDKLKDKEWKYKR